MADFPLTPNEYNEYPQIPGLSGMAEFIEESSEHRIVEYLDRQMWKPITPNSKNSRRVQQYGYRYDYTSRSIDRTPIHPLEEDIQFLGEWLQDTHWLFKPVSDSNNHLQCIVNEYHRNQGISPHSDNILFGPIIATISLLDDTVMTFTHKATRETHDVFLPRRGILVMEKDARYHWEHSISSRIKYTDPKGAIITKPTEYRRISLTYRTI